MTIEQFKEYLSSSDSFSFQNGIWYSTSLNNLSYPEEGTDFCFEIEENSFWFRHRNNCLTSVIKRYFNKHCFFDVGGGNGFVTKAISEIQIPSVLIEPQKQGVINAKKRKIENIFCGSLGDLKELAGQIPSIGLFDVIEHINDDGTFIHQVNEMLENGGTFFVTVPAFQFLWSDDDKTAGHFRRYNKKKMIRLLKDNSFDIIYSTYFFSFLIFPVFFIRTLPSKLRFRNKSRKFNQREHKQSEGLIGKILYFIWNWELKRIQQQKSILFGTSCLIVANKKQNGNPI